LIANEFMKTIVTIGAQLDAYSGQIMNGKSIFLIPSPI